MLLARQAGKKEFWSKEKTTSKTACDACGQKAARSKPTKNKCFLRWVLTQDFQKEKKTKIASLPSKQEKTEHQE